MFGIKNKQSGKFFTGFDSENNSTWGASQDAKTMSRLAAKCQAQMLAMIDSSVQKQPVKF